MTRDGNPDYAQARLQARHGLRPRAADWSRLEASRDLQHFLSAATNTPLARWVRSLTPQMDPHDLERALRTSWRSYVREISSWLPCSWQPAVLWAGTLPDLACVARLADPTPCPNWMFADPLFGPVAPGSPPERAAALELTELAPIAAAVGRSSGVRRAWLTQWQRLLPATDQDVAEQLQRLTQAVAARTAEAVDDQTSQEAAFADARRQMQRVFRESAGTVASALAHLALTAFDLERLRGRIAEHAVFTNLRQAA